MKAKTFNELRLQDTFLLLAHSKVYLSRRHEVPADNHCLFYSIYYTINEAQLNQVSARQLRQKIAFYILEHQDQYNEVVLGKSPLDYSAWIQSDASWGGSIELRIFSDLYRVQIHAGKSKKIKKCKLEYSFSLVSKIY